MSSYLYRKSHCGDKTVIRSSYLHNGISYTGKMTSLYWIRALVLWAEVPFQYKDCLSQAQGFPYKDKMVSWPSYLYIMNAYAGKIASSYWISPQGCLARQGPPINYHLLVYTFFLLIFYILSPENSFMAFRNKSLVENCCISRVLAMKIWQFFTQLSI